MTGTNLMHVLHFLGTYGEGGNNSNIRNTRKQGRGPHESVRDTRVIRLIEGKIFSLA